MGVPARKQEVRRDIRPHSRMRVVDGGTPRRPRTRTQPVSQSTVIACFIALFLVSSLAFGRVWLTSIAVNAEFRSTEIRQQLEAARAHSDQLEVRFAFLARPDRIRVAAEDLSMGPAGKVSHIDLGGDEVEVVASLPDSAFSDSTSADMGGVFGFIASLIPAGQTGAERVGTP